MGTSKLPPEVQEALQRDAEKMRKSLEEEMTKVDIEVWKEKNFKMRITNQELPPEGYMWFNRAANIAACSLCGALISASPVLAINTIQLHTEWHVFIRQIFKVVQMKLGGVSGG